MAATIVATLLAVWTAPIVMKVGAVVFAVFVVTERKTVFGGRGAWGSRIFVCAMTALACVTTVLVQEFREPSLREQLDRELRTAAGFRVAGVYRMPLRGGETADSFVVILRDRNSRDNETRDVPTTASGDVIIPRSDEVRIYNDDDGSISLAFRFLPQGPGQVRQLPEGDFPSFRFGQVGAYDLTGSGRVSLVAEFTRVTMATGAMPVPVLVVWDPETDMFSMSPLIPAPPDLAPLGRAADAIAGFTSPTVIRDRHSNTVLRGYPADAYKLWPRKVNPAITAYYSDPLQFGERGQVSAWTLDAENGSLESGACQSMRLDGGRVVESENATPAGVLAKVGLSGFGPPCTRL